MKIYIASHDRWAAEKAASVLSNAGHYIASQWHQKAFLPTDEHTVAERREIALEDVHDLSISDALVLIAGPDRYSGGKFVEAGIAIGQGKPVVVIGRRENMLMWLPIIQQVESAEDAVQALPPMLMEARRRSPSPETREGGTP